MKDFSAELARGIREEIVKRSKNSLWLAVRNGIESGQNRRQIQASLSPEQRQKGMEYHGEMMGVKAAKEKIIQQARQITPVLRMYHVLPVGRKDEVLEEGLKPDKPLAGTSNLTAPATKGEVYLFKGLGEAVTYAQSKESANGAERVIAQVDVGTNRLLPDLDYVSKEDGFKVKGGVKDVKGLVYKSLWRRQGGSRLKLEP